MLHTGRLHLARYAVRTPAWVWGGLAFAAVAIALLAWRALPWLGGHGVVTLGLFALIALLPALTVWSSAPYRVGRLAGQRELPRVVSLRPDLDHLDIDLDAVAADSLVNPFDHGTLSFEAPNDALADLAAVSNGQPALGPVGWVALFDELEAVVREKRPADARDAQLEAQLDEELRRRRAAHDIGGGGGPRGRHRARALPSSPRRTLGIRNRTQR